MSSPTSLTLSLVRSADLTDTDRMELHELTQAVFPPTEWPVLPGSEREWAEPQWSMRLCDSTGKQAAHGDIVVREALHDNQPVRIGGLGNVKTHPAYQRQGCAEMLLRRFAEFSQEQPGIDFGLLVCEPRLLAYYGRFGWREFPGRLLVRQRGVLEEFTFAKPMLLEVNSPTASGGAIDLLGPPW